jgi:hypothetical protein
VYLSEGFGKYQIVRFTYKHTGEIVVTEPNQNQQANNLMEESLRHIYHTNVFVQKAIEALDEAGQAFEEGRNVSINKNLTCYETLANQTRAAHVSVRRGLEQARSALTYPPCDRMVEAGEKLALSHGAKDLLTELEKDIIPMDLPSVEVEDREAALKLVGEMLKALPPEFHGLFTESSGLALLAEFGAIVQQMVNRVVKGVDVIIWPPHIHLYVPSEKKDELGNPAIKPLPALMQERSLSQDVGMHLTGYNNLAARAIVKDLLRAIVKAKR